MSSRVRIPADVDRPDRVLGPLTARQVAILALAAVVLYTAWSATRMVVALPVFLIFAIPVAAGWVVLALGQRDGLTLDRFLLVAIGQWLRPRHRVPGPDGRVCPAPGWLTGRATTPGAAVTRPAGLRLPATGISETGVIDLGAEGLAVVAVASTVNFALRTPAEQEGLVTCFGRYLHSLDAPVQILVRTHRLDLSGHLSELREHAGGLAHPALETAALQHAEHLHEFAERTDLLRRQVLLILRDRPRSTPSATPQGPGSVLAGRLSCSPWRRDIPSRGRQAARRAAESRLMRRVAEAVELLAPAGIVVTPLDAGQATAALAAACNPDTVQAPSSNTAGAGQVITTGADQRPRSSPDDTTGQGRWDEGGDTTEHPADHKGIRAESEGDQPGAARWAGRRRARLPSRMRCGDPAPQREITDGGAAFLPDAVSVGARHLQVGTAWVASFAVTGYPRQVHPGWLAPLLTYPARLDIAVHVDPIDAVTAAARLQRQLAKLESGHRHADHHGRLRDPQAEAATEDAHDLAARVARGEGRLFRVGLYLTVHAPSEQALAEATAGLRALTASLLLDAKPTTYRSLQGWTTTLPMGLDLIGLCRTFDTEALAAAFPFTSPDLPAPDPTGAGAPTGVLYGTNLGSQGLVHWDRFACDNHNSVILGRSGAGKSYLVKLEVLRSLFRGVDIQVIDPEDEYTRLATAVGGVVVQLGRPGVRLNPFDLPLALTPDGRRIAPKDALIRRSLFLHTLLSVLFGGQLLPAERAVADRAITTTYQQAGITADPRTWTRPAPVLHTLREALASMADGGDTTAGDLAARLHPYVDGAFRDLFDGPTSTAPQGHLVVFSLRELPEELKPVATLLTLDAVWRQVSHPVIRRRRMVVVDEAWLLMHTRAGAEFLFRMAKAARKHWAGLTIATQDIADVLGSDLGKAVVANAATQILLRQAPQTIDHVARTFTLSTGERHFLLSADRGQGLLCAGTQRVAFQSLASATEHALVTTDPAELADLDPPARAGTEHAPVIDLGPTDTAP